MRNLGTISSLWQPVRAGACLFALLLVPALAVAQPAPPTGETCVMSDASAAAYDDGWQDGDNDGTGFGPWQVFTTAADPGNGGFFMGNSTLNGDGDTNGDGDINTAGRAWGLYANSGEGTFARRPLTSPLVPGSVLKFQFDNGSLQEVPGAVQNVEFNLENGSFGELMRFQLLAGDSEYHIIDASGFIGTGVAPTDEGLQIEIEVLALGEVEVTITPLDGATPAVVTATLSSPPGGQVVESINFFNRSAGFDPPRDLFVNSLKACYPVECSFTQLDETVSKVGGRGQIELVFTNPDGIRTVRMTEGSNLIWESVQFDDGPVLPIGFPIESRPSVTNNATPQPTKWTVILTQDDTGNPTASYFAKAESNCGDNLLVTDFDPPIVFESDVPEDFTLEANYPNPFNPETTIGFTLPESAQATLAVYDVTGRLVKTLTQGTLAAGTHQVRWDGTDEAGQTVASGLYLYRLEAGTFSQSRTMVLMK